MAGRFSAQMSSQMSGCPLAIRVMSRKPPAARRSSAACSSARSAATPIRLAAVRWGTWLTTATISSWRSGGIATTSAPSSATTAATRRERRVGGARRGRQHPHRAAEHRSVGAVEAVELAAGHRVTADEAGVGDGGGDAALHAADVGDDAAGLGQRPLDLIGDGQHRDGDERDRRRPGSRPTGIDAALASASLDPRRIDVVTGDVPAALAQREGDRATDQPEPDHVGAASARPRGRIVPAGTAPIRGGWPSSGRARRRDRGGAPRRRRGPARCPGPAGGRAAGRCGCARGG